MRRFFLLLSIILFTSFELLAKEEKDIALPNLFCDYMVVQRNLPIKIWGECSPNAKVVATFAGEKKTVQANDTGAFELSFPPMQADGVEYKLVVKSGKKSVKISHILVGDVYLAAGQSNMAFRLQSCTKQDVADAKEDADYPQIRHYEVAKIVSGGKVLNTTDKPWQTASAATVPGWSAVAFYTARNLYKHNKVPVGIINCSQGSASADAFIRSDYYTSHLDTKEVRPEHFTDIRSNYKIPSVLYTSMLSKVVGYPLAAVWWYQAEANANRAFCYDKILTALIGNIREDWQQPNLPFLFVQLPGYGKTKMDWVTTRQKQFEVSCNVPNTGMVVAIDVGEENDIHPKNKKVLGERLALLNRSKIFGEDVSLSPIASNAKSEGAVVTVSFDNATALQITGEALSEVEVAGSDQKFYPANSKLDAARLQAWSDEVKNPRYIRYAWKNYPQANLYNEAMLPVAPFLIEVSD